ncbi:PIN-like domain-containing protein [Streptomyces sp. NPDC002911]
MSGTEDEYPLFKQYRDWIQNSTHEDAPGREQFFTRGTVVLDTNVLLSLYEYTPQAREQVFGALRSVHQQLWLPHQVGLEFVQNRHRIIVGRKKALDEASKALRKKMSDARTAIADARKLVQDLLIRYAQDYNAKEELDVKISDSAITDIHAEWNEILVDHIKQLKDYDLAISSVDRNDPVLSQVAELFNDRIAGPPDPAEIRRRVEEAASYRFPNRIPPGFSDEGKQTALSSSGDYLLWEETITHMASAPERSHLLFVSNDTKEDWYQPAGNGQGSRPWPYLTSELRMRTGAELRIETPGEFYRGINRFLNAEIAETTYAEIDRAAKSPLVTLVTEERAVHSQPSPHLVEASLHAIGVDDSVFDGIGDTPSQLLFSWWLIGVTAQLGRRERFDDEPEVLVMPATRSDKQPDATWLPGVRLHLGEWPYRSSSWIAPWFAQAVESCARRDRKTLQGLAAQQLDLRINDHDQLRLPESFIHDGSAR